MKRLVLFGTAAALLVASIAVVPATARAQLTMQMSNGWSLNFSGNVNAFLVYQFANTGDNGKVVNGGLVPTGEGTNPRIRTGLLPAFATFDVKGTEGPLKLGVHFGFAPQIQNGGGGNGNVHDNFGNGTQAGAQIDMRQVYLTLGGDWGQILAGRELGLFDRQNILQDMTLFGIGATGGNLGAGGTTLGRIGFGYVYPNFVPQMTYSTPASKSVQWAIGIFDPSTIGGAAGGTIPSAVYKYTRIPRIESELSWTGALGGGGATGGTASASSLLLWVGGLWQNAYNAPSGGTSVSAVAGDAGVKLNTSVISIVASGYYGKGIGSTLLLTSPLAVDAGGKGRTSYGGYGQVVFKLGPKWSVGGSFGGSLLKASSLDNVDPVNGPPLLKSNLDGSGILSYQWTKALRWVGEYDWTQAKNQGGQGFAQQSITGSQAATGFMLFF